MKTEGQVVYDNLASVRRLLNMPFEKSMNKYKEFTNVNISFVEIDRIDDALRLLKKQNELIEQYDKWAEGKITLCRDCKFLHGCKVFNIHGENENWFCADGVRR